ncbi:MAG: hypothetical protein LBU26_02135 [Synergistaceae bacterium]|jgi:hypothetical protein|nr:hypothetical protein [Synergistaceae bacterium]
MEQLRNDWRFQGQDKYLNEAELLHMPYLPYSEQWEHEHCDFCTAKISNYEGDLHIAYCTINKRHWICEECFNDFKDMFKWKVV